MISCTKCSLQYVGKTTQQLNTRFSQHRHNIIQRNLNTFLVNHFDQADHHYKHLSIQIIDHIDDNTDDVKHKLEDLETYWMKALNTIYPYGLNDQVKGVGLISRTNISAFNKSNSPYFSKPFLRVPRSHGSRKSNRCKNKNNKINISTVALELYDCFKEHGLSNLYTTLRGLSYDVLLALRLFLSSHSDEFSRQFMDCIYAFSSQMVKPKGPIIIVNVIKSETADHFGGWVGFHKILIIS